MHLYLRDIFAGFYLHFLMLANGWRELVLTHVHPFSWHSVKTSCVAQENALVVNARCF